MLENELGYVERLRCCKRCSSLEYEKAEPWRDDKEVLLTVAYLYE